MARQEGQESKIALVAGRLSNGQKSELCSSVRRPIAKQTIKSRSRFPIPDPCLLPLDPTAHDDGDA